MMAAALIQNSLAMLGQAQYEAYECSQQQVAAQPAIWFLRFS